MELGVAEVHEAISASRPGADCLVARDRRYSWAEVTDRTRRVANVLLDHGLGCHTERSELAGHQSGQDHLGIYLYNCPEYLEGLLGAFKARVAPFNVNYRYVAEELRYLLLDASASAVMVHSQFAPTLQAVRAELPALRLVLQVPDDSGNELLPGALWYDDALAAASAQRPPVQWSPDDLYILYTGGTTGRPKGVLWRNADANIECFGGTHGVDLADAVAGADRGTIALLVAPFMHGSGHWTALRTWNEGGTVVLQSEPRRLDPVDVWTLVERERVSFLLIVGDAFALPLLDELDRGDYDVSSLTVLLSGGAPLSAHLKQRFLEHLPAALVVDGMGSSEAGGQLAQVTSGGTATTGTFRMRRNNVLLSSDLTRILQPGDDDLGWLAKSGRLALGYLGDPAKTAATFPTVDGVRYVVPGDRARLRADGLVELHGRDSVTINSGGEKIFAEEVEAAVKAHPAVYDCVVAGRPSARWGQEVVAVVQLREGATAGPRELLAEAERHIARYKLPKAFAFVPEVVRSPAGKADYRWAREVAAASATTV